MLVGATLEGKGTLRVYPKQRENLARRYVETTNNSSVARAVRLLETAKALATEWHENL